MKTVFLLQHSYEKNEDYHETKIIGIFSSRKKAEETIEKLKKLDGFKEYPDCFYIDEYRIDQENWTEGFAKIYY